MLRTVPGTNHYVSICGVKSSILYVWGRRAIKQRGGEKWEQFLYFIPQKAYLFTIKIFTMSSCTRTHKLLSPQILWNLFLFLAFIEMFDSFTREHFQCVHCIVQNTSHCNYSRVKKSVTLSESIPLTKSTIQSFVPSAENIWNKTLHTLSYNHRCLDKKMPTL